MYDLTESDEGREWVEIFNNGTESVDLSEWKFSEGGTSHSLSFFRGDSILTAHSYAIIVDDPAKFLLDYPNAEGMILKSSFSLNNSGETISIKNRDLLINEVTYNSLVASGDGKSLQLIGGVWLAALPTPGKPNAISEASQNKLPIASFSYLPETPKAGEEITFDAGVSNDEDGTIDVYKWNFGDGTTLDSNNVSVKHIFLSSGTYSVKLIVGDDKNALSEPFLIDVAVADEPLSDGESGEKAEHVVISEIQAGTDENSDNEFVELYNPTAAAVTLDGWELRKKSSTGTESNLVDDGKFTGTILAKGFFLIAHPDYKGSKTADLIYSVSTGLAYENNAIILYDADNAEGEIIDEVAYEEIPKGKSLERQAWKNGFCFPPFGEYEFSGNGCDANTESGFDIREIPNPQNSQSLLEPREAPVALGMNDWQINYDFDKVAIDFTFPVNNAVSYRILDAETKKMIDSVTSATSIFSKRIDEVARNYKYEVRVADKDGLASAPSDIKEINIPSYIQDFNFYRASHYGFSGEIEEPLIEFSYDAYPFMPRDVNLALAYGEPPSPNYKIMVLYLNTEAPKDLFLNGDSPLAENAGSALQTQYNTCAGSLSWRTSLVMADAAGGCDIFIGGIPNGALAFDSYFGDADNHLLLPARRPNSENNFTPNDFVTVAFYGFYRFYPQGSSGDFAYENFKLLAVDRTRYYFQTDIPAHIPPSPPSGIEFSFDGGKSELSYTLSPAIDPDTPDNLLSYEISFDAGSTWEKSGLVGKKMIEPGKSYIIKAKATDEFGLGSGLLEKNYDAPALPSPFGISNIRWEKTTGGVLILNFDYPAYPFMTGRDNDFDAMVFYLNNLPPGSPGNFSSISSPRLRVSHQSCAGGSGNFGLLVLSRSPDMRGELFANNTCKSWLPELYLAALVPVPVAGQPGTISLPITGLLNSDKTLANLNSTDYITIGFYNIDPWGNLITAGADANKYYFQP